MQSISKRTSFLGLVAVCLVALLLGVSPTEAKKRSSKKDEKVVPAGRQHDVLYQEGLLYFRENQLARAKEKFYESLEAQPKYTEALYMLGVTHYTLLELDKAEKMLREALEVNPFFTDAHLMLGIVYDKKGELDQAITEWRIVISDKNFPQPWNATFNMGKAFADRGDWENALVWFQRTVSLNSEWFRGWYHLGLAEEELGNLSKAMEAYEKSLDHAPKDTEQRYMLQYRLALSCYKQGFNLKALENFKTVSEERPDTPEGQKAKEFVVRLESGDRGNQRLPTSIYN